MGLGEGVKVWKDLLGMWLSLCDADDGLVTELGLCGSKQGRIIGEGELEQGVWRCDETVGDARGNSKCRVKWLGQKARTAPS